MRLKKRMGKILRSEKMKKFADRNEQFTDMHGDIYSGCGCSGEAQWAFHDLLEEADEAVTLSLEEEDNAKGVYANTLHGQIVYVENMYILNLDKNNAKSVISEMNGVLNQITSGNKNGLYSAIEERVLDATMEDNGGAVEEFANREEYKSLGGEEIVNVIDVRGGKSSFNREMFKSMLEIDNAEVSLDGESVTLVIDFYY